MARRTKGRRDQGTGTVSQWTRNGVHIGWKGYLPLPRGQDGKRRNTPPIYRRGTTMEIRQDLERELDRLAQQMRNGGYSTPDRISPIDPFRMYLQYWLSEVAPGIGDDARAPATLDGYERKLRLHVIPRLGSIKLYLLRPTDFVSLYSSLRGDLSATSINHIHKIVRKALNDAVRLQLIPVNPVEKLPVKGPGRPKVDFIPPDDIPSVVDGLTGDWLYSYLRLALVTGCRRGELCALRLNDLDWDACRVRVDESCTELPGQPLIYGPTKTGRTRYVLVPADTMEMLRAHVRAQSDLKLRLGPAWRGTDLLFTTPDGAPLRPTTASKRWQRVRQRLGIESARSVKLHGLRHTHATLLVESGVDIRLVAERLGHSEREARRTYIHTTPPMEQAVVDKLSARSVK